jgi:hypothetical protein
VTANAAIVLLLLLAQSAAATQAQAQDAQPTTGVAAQAKSASPGAQAKPDSAKASQAVREIFADRKYQFCHHEEYPLTATEKQWCDLGAGADRAACPSLAQACRNEAKASQVEIREPFSFHLPELGLPMRLLLWTLLGVCLGLLIFALIRHFLDRTGKTVVVRASATDADPDGAAAAAARQVETDVQRLLERARAQAARGDFRAAIGDTYAALLRRLEGDGLLRIDPDQTNGDFVRKVRRDRPAVAASMQAVVDTVEQAQFGRAAIGADTFESVWRGVMGMLRQGAAMVLLFACLVCGGCGDARDDWERSPSGRAAIIDFLGKRGFVVRERLLSVSKIEESNVGQVVLLPDARLEKEEWAALQHWIAIGSRSLIVAGKCRGLPDWIGLHVAEKAASASSIIRPSPDTRWGSFEVRVPQENQLLPGANDRPLLLRGKVPYASARSDGSHENGNRARVQPGDGHGDTEATDQTPPAPRIVVLADDFLFRNASLLVADNALALELLLREGSGAVELVGNLTGLVATNPVESVQRGRLGPALLQLMVLALVFFGYKGARFGRPVATEQSGRRAFVEHVQAVGLQYARAMAERHALALLGQYVVERLRERLGQAQRRGLSGLAEAVASRTGRPVGEVMRLLVEARDAAKGVPADQDEGDLETARTLCKLLDETGGSGGHKPVSGNL